MKATSIRLADGRELIYYDERDGFDRGRADLRDLPTLQTRSEIRKDVLLDEWVIMASHRQGRTHLPPANECPLDPSTPTRQTEIPASDYDVVVFENRFPSLSPRSQVLPDDDGLFERLPGVGRCEVVCFTPKHGGSLGELPLDRLRLVVDVWAERTRVLGEMPGVQQVFPFENRGEEIGVTLSHPHGQIYAYPFVTPRTARELASAGRHHDATGRCLYCDVVAAEVDAGQRVVAVADGWVAFVPVAARWPFEVHLYPTRHLPDLPATTDDEREALVPLLNNVLRAFDRLFDQPMPYMLAWQQAPVRAGRDLGHLHLTLFSSRRSAGKLKYLASSESAAGAFINDVLPEHAAELLRQALP